MSNNSELNQKIHEKLNDWMSKLDQMQVQLSLGKMEAADEYQTQKKNLNNYLHEFIQNAHHAKDVAADKANAIKSILGDYKEELKKEEAATEQILEAQKKAAANVISKIKNA